MVALKKDLSILILLIDRFWDNIAPNSRQLLPWDAVLIKFVSRYDVIRIRIH